MTLDEMLRGFIAVVVGVRVSIWLAEAIVWVIEQSRNLSKLEESPQPGPPLLRMLSGPVRISLGGLVLSLIAYLIFQWLPLAWLALGFLGLCFIAPALGRLPQLGRRVMRLFST